MSNSFSMSEYNKKRVPLSKRLDFKLSSDHNYDRIETIYGLLLKQLKRSSLRYRFLSNEEIDVMAHLSIYHDAGKMKIPDDILHAKRRLTEGEFELMKLHTTFGVDTLKEYGFYPDSRKYAKFVSEVVLSHHERWDGKGYPRGLKGKEIPVYAQLMVIADVYDAVRRKRDYKPAMSHEQAVALIRSDGGHFSPLALKCFMAKEKFFGILFPGGGDPPPFGGDGVMVRELPEPKPKDDKEFRPLDSIIHDAQHRVSRPFIPNVPVKLGHSFERD